MSGLATIGVDVGGTNTDAAIIDGHKVKGFAKAPTTDNITSGIISSVKNAMACALESGYNGRICQINIGTTHFVNAVVQRQNLSRVAVIRLCGPATRDLPPFSNFPKDLKNVIKPMIFMAEGGYQYNGIEITEVNFEEINTFAKAIVSEGIKNVVICGTFSPVRHEQEDSVRKWLSENFHDLSITVSHEIGTMNLLERENAAILNECLKDLSSKTIKRFEIAFQSFDLKCPIFLTQNDGTIMSERQALEFPVFTFSSGPTNSIRGAVLLTGINDGLVMDVGGTSTEFGLIKDGFPYESATEIKIGGVSTNFKMPNVISEALGGGSVINPESYEVGPLSVGNKINVMAKVFGGATVTLTDIIVAAKMADIGDGGLVEELSEEMKNVALGKVKAKIEEMIDKTKISSKDVPLILVGGGCVIVDLKNSIKGISKIVRPENFAVANAVGAAYSQIGGNIDEIISTSHGYEDMIKTSRNKAIQNAIINGASPDSIEIVQESIIPLNYLTGDIVRAKIKAVGNLKNKLDDTKFQNISEILPKIDNTISYDAKDFKAVKIEYADICSSEKEFIPSKPKIIKETGEWEVSRWDVECLAIGAGILGCGGGGSPYLGRIKLLKHLEDGEIPRIVHPQKLINDGHKDDVAICVAYYGSPTSLEEKIGSPKQVKLAIEYLKEIKQIVHEGKHKSSEFNDKIKKCNDVEFIENFEVVSKICLKDNTKIFNEIQDDKVACACSLEIGGMNAIEPMIFGCRNNLPIIDSDCIGRAVPELQMICPSVHDSKLLYPIVMVDIKGNSHVILGAESFKKCEDHCRRVVMDYGCDSLIASCGLNVEFIKNHCIGGSLSRCWLLGNAVMLSKVRNESPYDKIIQQNQGEIICFGKIIGIRRQTTDGFSRGEIILTRLDNNDGTIIIEFQNEYIIAYKKSSDDKEIIAMVPDLISLVDQNTCMPITSDMVQYGQRVTVLLLYPPPQLQSENMLNVVGPRAFGIDADYHPEDRKHYVETYIPKY